MGEQLSTNYQCPNCGAPIYFSPTDSEIKCDYCGSQFEVAVIEKLYQDKIQAKNTQGKTLNWQDATPSDAWEAHETEGLQVYHCQSCGAEIVADEDTIATSCVYCGNPTILSGRLEGVLKPQYIIPFKIPKEEAIQALKKFYKGKRLLPKAFSKENHIQEIKGVYVPFWLYDATVQAKMVYDATKSHRTRASHNEIVRTSHYRVEREGSFSFEKIPADASTKMPDEYMDAIEPYRYEALEPFARAYLPGFLAEKYNVDAEACMTRINDRIINTAERVFRDALDYEEATLTNSDIQLEDKKVSYALLPVWLLNTQWHGKNYLFAMNGQTGRLIGDLPISKGQCIKWFLGVSVPLFAVITALLHFI